VRLGGEGRSAVEELDREIRDLESESRFRALIEKSAEVISLTAPDGTTLYMSPSVERMLGYRPSDLVGKHVFEFVHSDDRGPLQETLATLLQTPGSSRLVEFRAHHRNGEIRWVEATGTNLIDDPIVAAIVGNFRDVTDRKLAEEALRESKFLLEHAQAVAHVGSWAWDLTQGERMYWSRECARMFGTPDDSVIDRQLFLARIHPEDRDRVAAAHARALEGGPPCTIEYRIVRPNGEIRWGHSEGFVEFGEPQKPLRMVGVIQDITERRRATEDLRASEQRYRRIVETTSEGIWVIDAQSKTTFMNLRMAEMLGYTVEEASKRALRDFMDADAWAGAETRLAEGLTGATGRYQSKLKKKDGSDLWVSINMNVLHDAEGRYDGALALVSDISEERRAAAALARTEEQLRHAQKMEAVGVLAGGIAHDFNNLLSVIIGYTTLVVNGLPPNDPAREDLEEVQKAADRSSTLTRQLLAFSRQQVLQPRILDFNQVVLGIEKMLQRLIGEDVTLALLCADRIGAVLADPGQIEQVIMNLVVNARDAMPKGGKLTIETSNVVLDEVYAKDHLGVKAGAYVMLAVTDTGIGMDAATKERIFEPFFTTKEKGKGTGLGLSTVFGIVQQSGGHIWVYSEPGNGTSFRIYLPIADAAANAALLSSTTPPTTLRGKESILLVEDDDQVRTIARKVLRQNGYTVLEAQNGGEAFLVSEDHSARIDLLITDVIMPRMNGRQLAKRLAQQRPEMKVLFMSGYTDNAIMQHGVLDSNVAYLQKPLTPEGLLRKVRSVLDGRP
jgi:PAS domain S-box-containing protein